MRTRLTVRIDDELIRAAKRYARQNSVSLSQLVENYLQSLIIGQNFPSAEASVLQQLTGVLPPETALEEYHQHLVEKYR